MTRPTTPNRNGNTMAHLTAPANSADRLEELLSSLSEAEIAKVEAHPQLRRDKDQCLAGDNIAQALVGWIRAGVAEARSRSQSADESAKQKNNVLDQAQIEESKRTQHKNGSRRRYEEVSQAHHELVRQQGGTTREQHEHLMKALHAMEQAQNEAGQAICAVDQAQHEVWEAQVKVQKCSDEVAVRLFLGKLAIDAVLGYQSGRIGVVWDHILWALEDQDSGETASSKGDTDEIEQEMDDHSSDAWHSA